MKFMLTNIQAKADAEVLTYSDKKGGFHVDKLRELQGDLGLTLFTRFLDDVEVVKHIKYDIDKLPKDIIIEMQELFTKIEDYIAKESLLTKNKLEKNNVLWDSVEDRNGMERVEVIRY